MTIHRVEQGECLRSIAARFGLGDPLAVYQHPSNERLRELRPNPSVLFPGDEVFIPDRQQKRVLIQTGARHVFRLRFSLKGIQLRLLDPDGVPLKGLEYRAEVEGKVYEGRTDDEGVIRFEVPARATAGTLSLCGRSAFDLNIGNLNPMSGVPAGDQTGMVERLRNLGYGPFPSEGRAPSAADLALAIAQFEKDNGIPVTGEPTKVLWEKLVEAHGC